MFHENLSSESLRKTGGEVLTSLQVPRKPVGSAPALPKPEVNASSDSLISAINEVGESNRQILKGERRRAFSQPPEFEGAGGGASAGPTDTRTISDSKIRLRRRPVGAVLVGDGLEGRNRNMDAKISEILNGTGHDRRRTPRVHRPLSSQFESRGKVESERTAVCKIPCDEACEHHGIHTPSNINIEQSLHRPLPLVLVPRGEAGSHTDPFSASSDSEPTTQVLQHIYSKRSFDIGRSPTELPAILSFNRPPATPPHRVPVRPMQEEQSESLPCRPLPHTPPPSANSSTYEPPPPSSSASLSPVTVNSGLSPIRAARLTEPSRLIGTPLNANVCSSSLSLSTDFASAELEPTAFLPPDDTYWKYHILKYSKDLYLTTNPDEQHLDRQTGPSYYVDVDFDDQSTNFTLRFLERAKEVMKIEKMSRQTRVMVEESYLVTFADDPSKACVAERTRVSHCGNQFILNTAFSGEKKVWIIGNRTKVKRARNLSPSSPSSSGVQVKVDCREIRFYAQYDDHTLILANLKRRKKAAQRLVHNLKRLSGTAHLADKQPIDPDLAEGDSDVFGWLYIYDTIKQEDPLMWNLVLGLTVAVGLTQRLGEKGH